MDEAEFFAPWRLVAAFADGSRLTFDGLTEEQAQEAMEAAQKEHGDISFTASGNSNFPSHRGPGTSSASGMVVGSSIRSPFGRS